MRIAHLSDFHMRHHLPGAPKNPDFRNWEIPALLEPVIARLRNLAPDLLVASGDLIDYPLDQPDDPERRAQGAADLALLRTLLEQAGCPLAVVPGNHDHPALFDQVFGDLPQDFVCAGRRVLTFYDAEDADHVPHRSGSDRDRFDRALTATQDSPSAVQAGLPQVHVQHFLIWPRLNEEYPYNYLDCEAMLDALAASQRVQLCLGGHYHLGVGLTPVRGVYFAGVPAFCEPPHPLWIYDLADDNADATVTVTEYTH